MSAAQTDREQLLSWIDWLIDWLLIFFFFDFFSVSEEFTASRFYSLIFPFKNRGLLLGVEDFSFSGGASLMRIFFFFLAYAWVKERGINLSQGGNISIFLSGPQLISVAAESNMKSVTVWMCVHIFLLLLGERWNVEITCNCGQIVNCHSRAETLWHQFIIVRAHFLHGSTFLMQELSERARLSRSFIVCSKMLMCVNVVAERFDYTLFNCHP